REAAEDYDVDEDAEEREYGRGDLEHPESGESAEESDESAETEQPRPDDDEPQGAPQFSDHHGRCADQRVHAADEDCGVHDEVDYPDDGLELPSAFRGDWATVHDQPPI